MWLWEVAQNHHHTIFNPRFELFRYVSLVVISFDTSFSLMSYSFFFLILFLIWYQVVFFGIDNIHAMRESLSRLRDYLDTHGSTSSDGTLSLLVSL
jgi:hypothetical protein